MQILVYVVLAFLWVLANISKTVQKKQQEKNQKKFETKYKNKSDGKQYKRKYHPKANLMAKFEQNAKSPKIQNINKLKSKINKLKTPAAEEITKITSKPINVISPKEQEETYGQKIISDLSSNPDELKKAILYHEILGKPLSLRD